MESSFPRSWISGIKMKGVVCSCRGTKMKPCLRNSSRRHLEDMEWRQFYEPPERSIPFLPFVFLFGDSYGYARAAPSLAWAPGPLLRPSLCSDQPALPLALSRAVMARLKPLLLET
ncbi:hypothetical protein CRG98_012364 [Punica granatum]|uniref:Uncharacterized protein n=1 Tax=Punica granatum TaxID=22663 RepID=A0A2I0KGA0_PUNGR|nr:hypothetical protein CRG98_012364 [Punica granatum]